MSPSGMNRAAGSDRSRLFVYNGGFLTQRRLRRILTLAGYDIRLGLPSEGDQVGIWGNSPTAHRGLAVAARHAAPLLRVEDAFLRSLFPGRAGEPPLGLLLDRAGVHFDPTTPSDLEQLLTSAPLDDTTLLNRARDAMARIRENHLSKYCATDPDLPLPEPGYVLVIDQTRGDASVTASGGNDALFREMLVFAQEEHPGARVLIKTHPETAAGFRPGYYGERDISVRVSLYDAPLSPWALLDGAVGVYTLSSQLGFEAILAGHKPRVFGQPFYAGWGLTLDEHPVPRRERRLTRAQLFAAAMILYPTWYDPFGDKLCELETVLDTLEAQTRAWRQDRAGWTAGGMRLWKRRPLKRMFGRFGRISFTDTPAAGDPRPHMVWAARAAASDTATRVEDGFLRSRGLGAELVPPLSLVTDDSGIYYDPTRPSALESLIARRAELRADQRQRAEALIRMLTTARISKYNLGGALPDLPPGHRILVPGQVEDDASILTGTGEIRSNLDLLRSVRAAHPQAVIVYKPHPDVEAGLRVGGIDPGTLADVIATQADPMQLLDQVNEVWTLTSLLGFEALLRGLPVTTLGAPFYAGWGLTRDLGPIPARRQARPDLAGLVHAALIDYPRYWDPRTGQPCPVEVAAQRLASGAIPHPGPANRLLSKLQGLLATHAHLWR
ncbi:capsular polysaccharide biosynthesis protein [Ruegeria pomeroyi]|uniref:Capsular polysaccharide export protein KpsC n=2 Tax=Ruegeria pomeroyi TaxID=89184 RepID=Q5LSL2_RUEPO|nr:capsular polysaccharide biosynthesis protein [Ruegeria pomeroyi]AAV95035.1 capsular polysaccharide export protein KpsC [Ruegeria pomeroyi DSS-3]NVK98081.1 capsular polysaccharide biosynthesis protein [Ruegeria pomeroyi]NVL01802.1 capsular polysaccharide biosynthesis protein [Ruegeria pomeroyi]QWV08613.1 capsular polysaccharide biosynthesis protein [Ruegeria pomeroyi]